MTAQAAFVLGILVGGIVVGAAIGLVLAWVDRT